MEISRLALSCFAATFTISVFAGNNVENTSTDATNTYETNLALASDLGVLPPNSILLGKSLGDWGGDWWKWAFSFSRKFSPISDTTGKLCSLGQSMTDDVWFLAGSYSTDPIVRECVIPEGKALFFPIINFIYYSPKNEEKTCSEITASVKKRTQIPYNLFIKINNKTLENPYAHREASTTCFDPFEKANDNAKKSWAYPGASNGYWIALEPLPVGTHVIQFGGNLTRFSQNITYKLHVVRLNDKPEDPAKHPRVNSI